MTGPGAPALVPGSHPPPHAAFSGGTGPDWLLIGTVAPLAGVLLAFALWMLWGGRLAPVDRDPDAARSAGARWRDGLTEASRLSIGLAAMGIAYHALSYAMPASWLPLRVPPERWYIVPLAAVLFVGGSMLVDRLLADPEAGRPDEPRGTRGRV
ncbi:MAG: hypothetical protein SFY69_07530 [Planctomycetota bacterium]|nr:hypothetical protein [Planctomycetota bacterium]